jgi:hypothetical protein
MYYIFGWFLLLIPPFLPYIPLPFGHVVNHPLLTWKSLFDARGVNVRPHSSLVGDKLSTPSSNSPPLSPLNGPLQFTFHVLKDDITKSGT